MEEQHSLSKISQDIVLKNERGEILILRHRKSGKWLLPGGRLNQGEKWIDGLKREVKEEIGTDDFEITGILEVDNWIDKGVPHYGVFFTGQIASNRKIILSDEHIEYTWVRNKQELDKFVFWHPDLKRRIIRALKKIED